MVNEMERYYTAEIPKSERIPKMVEHLYAKLPEIESARAILLTESYKATEGEPIMMVVDGTWKGAGVFNVEEFDPDPYMEALNKWGLPWVVDENPEIVK